MIEYDHIGKAGVLGMTSWLRHRHVYRTISWESFDGIISRMMQRFFFGPVGREWRITGQLIFDTQANRDAFIPLHRNFRRLKPYRCDNSFPIDEEATEEGTFPLPPTFRLDIGYDDEQKTLDYLTAIMTVPTGLVSAMVGRHKCRFDPDEPAPGDYNTETFYWSFP